PGGEQRIAAEQVLAEKIRHVPRRMPRNEENAPARLADRDLVALVDRPRDAGDALAVALVAVDRQFRTPQGSAVAARVVAVVVRVENRLGVDLLSVDPLQHRIGLRRVDDRGFAGLFAHGEVAVVVAQQRDLHDAHDWDIANSGENRNRGTKSRIDTAPVDRIASTLRMEDFAMDITKKIAEFVAGARYE